MSQQHQQTTAGQQPSGDTDLMGLAAGAAVLFGYTKDNGIMNYCADCGVEMGTQANVPVRCRPCIEQRNAVALALTPANTGTVYGEHPPHPPGGLTTTHYAGKEGG